MGDHSTARLAITVLSLLFYVTALIFNALAASGIGLFLTTTSNVSAKYETQLTPSGWTFSIWGVIYAWLTVASIYILSGLCRRNAYGYMYCSPAVLPYGFYFSWITNMVLNVAWLLIWDRELMIPGFIVLALIAFTNYLMIFFTCHGLHLYGAWLHKYHKLDLWLIRVCVQNGLATYATWTTLATLINLTIVMSYNAGLSKMDAAIVTYSILTVEVLGWFVLENFVFEKHVRYILTVYPVVILALVGNTTKNYNPEAPSRSGLFIVALLAVSCVLFAVRIALVAWRHLKSPLYREMTTGASSPMEIAEKQKKIFM